MEETCMKEKKINILNIENELNNIFLDLKTYIIVLNTKLFLKKLDPLINQNYTLKPYLLIEEINTKIFFLDEYNNFAIIYLKLYELYKRIKNTFNDHSLKILFSNESIKVLCVEYGYPEGDISQRRVQINNIYNNFINFEPKKSGNILLNFNYYNENVKVDFYKYLKKKLPKIDYI